MTYQFILPADVWNTENYIKNWPFNFPVPPIELFKHPSLSNYLTTFLSILYSPKNPEIHNLKNIILQFLINNHYFFYIRYKYLMNFNKQTELLFDQNYGKDTLLSIQKTIEYNNACDILLDNGDITKVTNDRVIIQIAKKYKNYFKAYTESLAEMNNEIKNFNVSFYFCNFLDAIESEKNEI